MKQRERKPGLQASVCPACPLLVRQWAPPDHRTPEHQSPVSLGPARLVAKLMSMVVLSPTPPLQDWASQEGKVFLGGPRRVSFVGPQKWELKIKLVFKELTLYLAVTQYTLN